MSFMGKNYTEGFAYGDINAPIPMAARALPASKRWYVDCINGDDSNTGSQSSPIQTLDTFFKAAVYDREDIRCYITHAGVYNVNYQSFNGLTIHITALCSGVTINFISPASSGDVAFYNCHINFRSDNPSSYKLSLTCNGKIYQDGGTGAFNGVDCSCLYAMYGGGAVCNSTVFRNGLDVRMGNMHANNVDIHYAGNNPALYLQTCNFYLEGNSNFVIADTAASASLRFCFAEGSNIHIRHSFTSSVIGTPLTATSQEWWFDTCLLNLTQSTLASLQTASDKINQSAVDGGKTRVNHCILGPATSIPEPAAS